MAFYSEFTQLSGAPASGDIVPIQDISDTTDNAAGTTKYQTVDDIISFYDARTSTMTNKTLTSPVLNTGVSGTAVLDEDNMSSDSATQLATQQSIKAYVDSEVQLSSTINFLIDGGGSAITTGIKGDVQLDFACTIDSATLLADQSGSIVVDIWKDTYANFPATDADSITASAVPTISTATKSTDASLTGWTTSISAGDILRFNVDSVTSIERVTVALKVTRT
jgi:hypothetical protein